MKFKLPDAMDYQYLEHCSLNHIKAIAYGQACADAMKKHMEERNCGNCQWANLELQSEGEFECDYITAFFPIKVIDRTKCNDWTPKEESDATATTPRA